MKPQVSRSLKQENGDRVLLYHWALSNDHKNENIVCIDGEGAIRWRAALPEDIDASDCFVSLRAEGDLVVATTYSACEVTIDPETGNSVFCTKEPRGGRLLLTE